MRYYSNTVAQILMNSRIQVWRITYCINLQAQIKFNSIVVLTKRELK